MSERSGVGMVELAVLAAAESAGAPAGGHVKSARVLEALEAATGLAPGYGYLVLVDLAQPWQMPLPLVDGRGNFGSRGSDPPAAWQYTEAGLTPAGRVVLAAERGELAPVPVGLINGNTYRQGLRPPLRPDGVIGAIRRVLQRPDVPGDELIGMAGPPDFMTGCTVTGDLAAFAAGRPVRIRLEARITVASKQAVSAGGPDRSRTGAPDDQVLLIDNLPATVNTDEVVQAIAERARHRHWPGHQGLQDATRLPVRHVRDESSAAGGTLFACVPDTGTDPQELRSRLLQEVYGVSVSLDVQMPAALDTTIRNWVARNRGEDIAASLAALEQAVAARPAVRL